MKCSFPPLLLARRNHLARRGFSRSAVGVLLLALLSAGCSIESLVVRKLGRTLNGSSSIFASDEDPELVRDALPFALKTIEGLLAREPENLDLLVAACSGFSQYAYAFVETDALELEFENYRASRRQQDRADRLYERALGYCRRGLEVVVPGISTELSLDPKLAARKIGAGQIDLLYWTGATWGFVVANGADQPERIAEVPVPRALLQRVLDLDERYGQGAIHEAFVTLDALPEALGGSEEGARRHFARALELSQGQSASAFVALARGVAVANQDREEFQRLLEQSLAIDPDQQPPRRLANLIAQRRARILLERIDEYFL